MDDRLHVPIAVVAVHEHRQIACRHDVADSGADFAESHQPDIGNAIASADEREASNEVGLKAGSLDEPGTDRIVRAWKDQRLLAGNKSSKRGHGALTPVCFRTCSSISDRLGQT